MNDSHIDTIAEIAQKVSTENERRQRQIHSIDTLLTERQEVLVTMCALAELESKDASFDVVLEILKFFNQALVDYTALGHFEIYQRIIEGKERRESVKRVANQVYLSISASTEKIVEFNDKYEGADGQDSLTNLYKDLSAIGEAMAERIEAEDQLLYELSNRALRRNSKATLA